MADEAVVVGAVGGVGAVGVPEVFFLTDVVDLVYGMSPAVVDGQLVVWVAVVLQQVADGEPVVVVVVVRGDDVGELQRGGDNLDGVGHGVGAEQGVACEANVLLGEDKPYEVGGGQLHVDSVPAVGGVGDVGSVEVVGVVGLLFEQP